MKQKRTFEKDKQKTRAVQVRLTEAENDALKKIAVKKGYMFRSTAARMAIKQYIFENTEVIT